MKQAQRYIDNVLSGEEVCCEFVKLAVKRHLSDLEKHGDPNYKFIFSEKHGQRAISFFRLLRHTSGKLAGEPFNLQDNQAFKLAMLFGWRQKEDGNRRFTQFYDEEGRKGGKSQFAAGIEWYCGLCEGEESAEIYTAATTRDQADMVFRAVKKMGRYLSKDSKAMKKAINVMAHSVLILPTDSFIQKVSADAGTLDGLNPHCAIIDEYHAHKNDMVKGVMQTGMGSRSNPLLGIITTAGFDKESPCYSVERKNAVAVLKGERVQDNLFAIIFTLDDGDDWKDPSVWKKANPNLGSTPTVKYLEDQVQDAINKGASTRVQVITKNFNCWMDTPKVWIPEEVVKAAMRTMTLEEFAGRPCFAGLDLAATSDITALSLFFPPHMGDQAANLNYYFLPSDTIDKVKDDTNYRQWVEDGNITVTPGNITDYAFVQSTIVNTSSVVDLKSISYDQWNAYQMATQLTGEGFTVLPCRQNYGNLSEPLKNIEKMLLSGGIEIDENQVTLWMYRNIVLDYDANGNIKPNKAKSGGKIDGVAASAMAVFGWLTSLSQPGYTSYLFSDESEPLYV